MGYTLRNPNAGNSVPAKNNTATSGPRPIRFRANHKPTTTTIAAIGYAQTPARKSPTPVITIDGSVTPERIPDWVVWRELFRTAVEMSDRSSSGGQYLWMDRLHLSREQMNEVVRLAHEQRDLDSAFIKQSKDEIKNQVKGKPDLLKMKLKQIQVNRECRVLEYREKLRARLDLHAFERLQSYARLRIAPGIKVGKLLVKR